MYQSFRKPPLKTVKIWLLGLEGSQIRRRLWISIESDRAPSLGGLDNFAILLRNKWT